MAKGEGGDKAEKAPKEPLRYNRELPLKELEGTTVDAVVTAEARFNWMRSADYQTKNGDSCFAPYAEMITTVGLHLIAFVFQYVLIVYFTLDVVKPILAPFEPVARDAARHKIELAIASNNFEMVDLGLRMTCGMNTSYPWAHRLMMFVLLTKMLPEIGNALWRLHRMWILKEEPNQDTDVKSEKINHQDPAEFAKTGKTQVGFPSWKFSGTDKIEPYTWEMHQKCPLSDYLDDDNIWYTKRMGSTAALEKAALETRDKWVSKTKSLVGRNAERTWRDTQSVEKEWKHRIMILNKYGHSQKVKNIKDLDQEQFPLVIIKTELDQTHHIGKWSIGWKIFSTAFVLVPLLVMNCYMLKVGSQLIAAQGSLGKLVKTALKLKFLIKIPESVFEGYASENLRDFLEGTVYYTKHDMPEKQDPWSSWLSSTTKFICAWVGAYAIYDWGYHDIIEFRSLCTEYFSVFEGNLAGPRNFLAAW